MLLVGGGAAGSSTDMPADGQARARAARAALDRDEPYDSRRRRQRASLLFASTRLPPGRTRPFTCTREGRRSGSTPQPLAAAGPARHVFVCGSDCVRRARDAAVCSWSVDDAAHVRAERFGGAHEDLHAARRRRRPVREPTPGLLGGHARTRVYGRLDCPVALSLLRRGFRPATACSSPTRRPRSPRASGRAGRACASSTARGSARASADALQARRTSAPPHASRLSARCRARTGQSAAAARPCSPPPRGRARRRRRPFGAGVGAATTTSRAAADATRAARRAHGVAAARTTPATATRRPL